MWRIKPMKQRECFIFRWPPSIDAFPGAIKPVRTTTQSLAVLVRFLQRQFSFNLWLNSIWTDLFSVSTVKALSFSENFWASFLFGQMGKETSVSLQTDGVEQNKSPSTTEPAWDLDRSTRFASNASVPARPPTLWNSPACKRRRAKRRRATVSGRPTAITVMLLQ